MVVLVAVILFAIVGIWYYKTYGNHDEVVINQLNSTSTPTQLPSLEGCALIPSTSTIPLGQLPGYVNGDEDVRGGMICRFSVRLGLPAFTFHFAGEPDNTLGQITVSQDDSSGTIQIIDNSTAGLNIDYLSAQDLLILVDANFDGYKDLQIVQDQGADGNSNSDFYLYDPATHKFVYNSFLSGLDGPTFNSSTQQVNTFSSSDAADSEADTYQYQSGKYILIKEDILSFDIASGIETESWYELKNGKMKLANSTTTHSR